MMFMLGFTLACAPSVVKASVSASTPCDSCGGVCVQDVAAAPSRAHTSSDLVYTLSPPSGGDHDPCWAAWGVHADEVRTENWVHNLEHGGVVVLYGPSVSAEDVAALTAFVESRPVGRAILSPWSADLDLEGATIAVVAWEHRLLLGCADLVAIEAFYNERSGRAPEDVMTDPPSGCMSGDSG
jgi:hypothetical protein